MASWKKYAARAVTRSSAASAGAVDSKVARLTDAKKFTHGKHHKHISIARYKHIGIKYCKHRKH